MQLQRTWKSLAWEGTETFTSDQSDTGIRAEGHLTGTTEEGTNYEISYLVELSPAWDVQHVLVKDAKDEGTYIDLVYENGKWLDPDGVQLESFDGADYIDLSLSPFTNTLPIKRVQFTGDRPESIDVVYIELPQFTTKRVTQTYTKIGKNTYHYQDAAFSADIVVDDDGFVVVYPGLFCEKHYTK